jgi:hypothetical protein
MSLAIDDLAAVERVLASEGADAPTLAALKRQFPQCAWARCDAADVSEAPFRSFAAFDLHLIDAADHCVKVTDDPARATGFLLARRTSA